MSYDEDDMTATMEERGFRMTQLEIGQDWRAIPTTIWEAARQGDTDKIMMVTLSRTDANRRNIRKETPLHYAKDGETTAMLLRCGAISTLDAVDKAKRTPLHWAAMNGNEEKAKVLLRHGANPLLKDEENRTAVYYANERKHWKTLEIIAEAARRWNVGVQEMEGGILGEEEEDRKAKLLEDDAAYKRAPTLGAKGRDRTSFPPWMRKEIWSGPFEPLLGEEGKRLLKHYSLWSAEEVALFLATSEELNGMEDNVHDYCKRVKDAKIGGRAFHGLTKSKKAELLSMIEMPVHHRRRLIKVLEDVAEKQDIINFPGRKEMELMPYCLPIGVGKRGAFRIIGYVGVDDEMSISRVWKHVCGDAAMAEALSRVEPRTTEWWASRPDDERVCLFSSQLGKSIAKRRSSVRTSTRHFGELQDTTILKPEEIERRKKKRLRAKEEGLLGDDGLTSRERESLVNLIDPQFPAWDNFAPILLLQPRYRELYTAVKWGGMKEIRYWLPQHDLKRKEESWKMDHRLHIQGYEDKKKWAEQQVKENNEMLAKMKAAEQQKLRAKKQRERSW